MLNIGIYFSKTNISKSKKDMKPPYPPSYGLNRIKTIILKK